MTEKKQEKSKIIYPEKFNSNYIFTYFSFNEELKDLLEKSGQKRDFARKYSKVVNFRKDKKTVYSTEVI